MNVKCIYVSMEDGAIFNHLHGPLPAYKKSLANLSTRDLFLTSNVLGSRKVLIYIYLNKKNVVEKNISHIKYRHSSFLFHSLRPNLPQLHYEVLSLLPPRTFNPLPWHRLRCQYLLTSALSTILSSSTVNSLSQSFRTWTAIFFIPFFSTWSWLEKFKMLVWRWIIVVDW